ncbi:NAD(P)-dependent alcohol dehydrogenase [Carboxylicivirga caseinilyticus]|uniref:NAD(P)-dependent alcohol dehydrogenase n=1 Tax=Carboxylicivirga caseinilyticus TaxID=3417572 RepID=UPI003D34098D|nr:NAD(P)-dependent alcohol dehydrogenase [Marinilabiliaceae bacterium A049]
MKAVTYSKYGGPEQLTLKEVMLPTPKEDEVMIRVKSASINSRDWDMLTGRPKIYRLLFGFPKPKYPIIGTDIAGIVEGVGENVTEFKTGEKVYGANPDGGYGAFAEFITLPQNKVIHIPANMSMNEAAAIPEAGLLAYQALNYNGAIRPGQSVLINGAGGGAGTYAIQMAKAMGALVTAVDSGEKSQAMIDLGADQVLDFKQTNFASGNDKYDLIIDFVATRSFFNVRKKLNAKGAYVAVGGKVGKIISLSLLSLLLPKSKAKKVSILAYVMNKSQLAEINEMYLQGQIKPRIDKVFSLSDTANAMKYFSEGTFIGKIVIKI